RRGVKMAENERNDANKGETGGKGKKKLRILLRTFGCQMNVRDSEVICGLLKTENWQLTTNPHEADVIIFNTCSVRQHAEDKVWSEIGRFKKKGQSPLGTVFKGKETLGTVSFSKHSRALTGTVPFIGLVGCMAQNYKEKVFERAPQVDFVVGPGDLHKIPEIIKKFSERGLFEQKIWETDGNVRPDDIYHTGFHQDKDHSYVVISEGCSNLCSYCVVPYVRGPLRNRNYKDIIKEVEEAVDNGRTEITLLGQNVNAYEYDGVNFVKLVESIDSIKGIKEFSFITSHPKDTSFDLFKAMQELGKLKKYLHLPIQSGSDRILKLMNRRYSRKFYLDLVQNFRKIVKDGVLTTDIIVGFPTETEDDFAGTYNLVKDVQFTAAYIFKYSPRPHTEAEKLADDVDKKAKEARHKGILDLQKRISNKKKCLKR
ncbi:MAG: MiaB/RimO family radical SAM methylthiotransferase, partial [Candidatus Omnitrophica bacterium]|nr:MiaB/RimO family radical SAM methylthiotransferase [Candidatus Omnitrophota bacterium]